MLWFQDILVIWNQICDDIFPMSSLGEHFAWAMSQGGVSALRRGEGGEWTLSCEGWLCTWYPDLVSAAHSAQSFILITFWHHIITRHITSHHWKHHREGNGPSGHDLFRERMKMIFMNWREEYLAYFFGKFYSSTSGIIDKHDETLALNKLFWDKKSLGNIKRPAPATRLIHSVYFRKKLQVWNCERRTYVQSPKSTLSSLKDVCRRVFIIYSSCNSLLFDLRWWLDDFVWIMAVKICGSPSLARVQSPPAVDGGSPGAREIPPHPSRPSHLSDPQSGLWLTQTCLLGVSRWPGGANSQSSANNIPRGIIIPSSQCKRISLIHIIQNHNKTLLQLTASQYYPRVPGK